MARDSIGSPFNQIASNASLDFSAIHHHNFAVGPIFAGSTGSAISRFSGANALLAFSSLLASNRQRIAPNSCGCSGRSDFGYLDSD